MSTADFAAALSKLPPPWPAPVTRRDTVDILLAAGMWNWEGHGDRATTLRWYCAAKELGLPDSASYMVPVSVLNSYQARDVEIEFLREAATRWPAWH